MQAPNPVKIYFQYLQHLDCFETYVNLILSSVLETFAAQHEGYLQCLEALVVCHSTTLSGPPCRPFSEVERFARLLWR